MSEIPADPQSSQSGRAPSEIDAIAERYVHELAELVPTVGTNLGLGGEYDRRLPDYSPAGHAALDALTTRTLAALEAATPRDETDRVTLRALGDDLRLAHEMHEAGEHLRNLNVIASPLQGTRAIFDLMPAATTAHWEAIAARLSGVPAALAGYREALAEGTERGLMPARRQVREGAAQARTLGDPARSFFTSFVAGARPDGAEPAGELADALHAGADAAITAYAELAAFLDGLEDRAPAEDGVGRERYARFSRAFLGAEVDLEETYRWGLGELAAIDAEQRETLVELFGEEGRTMPITEAYARLDADPARQIHGTDALVEWMEGVSAEAIDALDGRMMDFPPLLRRLECKIAPTATGGIYYTGPSLDFSRPGRMWWSVPEGVTTFSTWQERTTVYHEGVPGHHLQVGYATLMRPNFNTWRSTLSWKSGHGEGWALYAERLMDLHGFLADPADRLGMLDAQRLRAARVALDIGVHLGLPYPAEWVPQGADPADFATWTADTAWEFLRANVAMEEKSLRFEWNRYLGWPGQAPSYKVGQRLWEQMRDDYLARHLPPGGAGAGAEDARREVLGRFHTTALSLGSMGLDALADALDRA